jgi:hypothetical protein
MSECDMGAMVPSWAPAQKTTDSWETTGSFVAKALRHGP